MGDGSNADIFRYGEREVLTFTGEQTTRSVVTTPEGQPSDGYGFPTGGSVYVNQNGGSSISVSVSLGGTLGSIGVSVGYANTSAISGLIANVPADKNHYRVRLRRNYTVKRYKVDTYKYNEYQYTTYKLVSTLSSIDTYVVKV